MIVTSEGRTKDGGLILVSGGAGFIGSNLVHAFAAEGRRVVVCDFLESGSKWRNLSGALIHDIVSPPDLSAWLAKHEGQVASVLHMGAISATTETDVDRLVSNNIRLSLDLWDWCRTHDVDFVYASSAATYGAGAEGFVDDNDPAALARLRPLNPYGWSKHVVDRRIIDDVLRGETAPTRWAGLKFFNVFGPREEHKGGMRSVVHQIYPDARQGKSVNLFQSDNPRYEDGGQLRDFIHVDDCVAVVRNILAAPRVSGVYNVGTGKARSFRDLAEATFAACGQPAKIAYREMPDSLKGRYQYFTQADVGRLTLAGLAPDFLSLEDGVAAYVRWLSENLGT